jgi:hypothetical protein
MPTCTRGVGASSKASRQSNATRRREPPRGSSNPRHLAMDYGGMAVSVARGCLHLSHLCLLRSCHVARLRGVGMGLGRYYTTIVCEPGLPRAFSLVSRRKEGVRLLLFRCARFLRSPTYVAVSEQATMVDKAAPHHAVRARGLGWQHSARKYVLRSSYTTKKTGTNDARRSSQITGLDGWWSWTHEYIPKNQTSVQRTKLISAGPSSIDQIKIVLTIKKNPNLAKAHSSV